MVTDKPGQLPEIEDLSLTGDPALAIESSKEAGVLVNMAAEKNQSIEPSGKIKQVNHALISQSSYLTKPPSASRALLSLFSSSRCWTLFSIIFVLGMRRVHRLYPPSLNDVEFSFTLRCDVLGFCFGGLLDSGMTLLVHARYGLNSRGAALVFIGAVVPSFASSPLAGHFADKYGASVRSLSFSTYRNQKRILESIRLTPSGAHLNDSDKHPGNSKPKIRTPLLHSPVENLTKPYKLPSHGHPDLRQASIVLYELDTFNCLSLEAKQALERFINIKVDLLSRHPDKLGIKYAKQFSLRSDASCSFRSLPHPNAACKKWRFGALVFNLSFLVLFLFCFAVE
ncbi:hypothetical protein KEM48_002690 [Puccinia striiformis f. sp. tritici PST-130]|nr:hypothetical protein KEM48_002690 [Puccinia striiformis f. sp. tritici PST-130]